jgi:hypothetical protein
MDISSPYDDAIHWHKLHNGRLFYMMFYGAPTLAMRVEFKDRERGTMLGCLFFVPKITIRYDQDRIFAS